MIREDGFLADWFISWNHWGEGVWQFTGHSFANSSLVLCCSEGSWSGRGLVVTGLVDRSCGIGWMSGCVAVLVPTAAALATSALWCSFLQVHATPGSSSSAGSTLRLVFRQLLGCGQKRGHGFLRLKVCGGGSSHQRLFMFYWDWHHHAQNTSTRRKIH